MNRKMIFLVVLGFWMGVARLEDLAQTEAPGSEPVAAVEAQSSAPERDLGDSAEVLQKESEVKPEPTEEIQISEEGKEDEERVLRDSLTVKDSAEDALNPPRQVVLDKEDLIKKVTYPKPFRAAPSLKRPKTRGSRAKGKGKGKRPTGKRGGRTRRGRTRRGDKPVVNYLHVEIDQGVTDGSRQGIVTEFLRKYMGVTKNESLSVSPMVIEGRSVVNRYKVLRMNPKTQASQEFTVDVDFADGNNDKTPYKSAVQVTMTSDGIDAHYLNDYDYTLQRDCEVIRAQLNDPISIQCSPFVNPQSYVLPQFYRVKLKRMRNGRTITQTRLVNVNYSNAQVKMPQIKPRTRGNFPKDKMIIELIQDRIKAIPFFRGKEKVLEETRKPVFVKKVHEYEKELQDFQDKMRKQLGESEKKYHERLKVELARRQVSWRHDREAFGRTFEIMASKSEEVNAFNIRTAIRRAILDLENEQVYQVYRSRVRHFRRETILTNLLDRMDYMRFLADKHLDDNFEHYHTPEYFRK